MGEAARSEVHLGSQTGTDGGMCGVRKGAVVGWVRAGGATFRCAGGPARIMGGLGAGGGAERAKRRGGDGTDRHAELRIGLGRIQHLPRSLGDSERLLSRIEGRVAFGRSPV